MNVRSNKVSDVRAYYASSLKDIYSQAEASNLLDILFEYYTGKPSFKLRTEPDSTISESTLLEIHFGVKDLLNNKPVQYITGETWFFGLKFIVKPGVLIPRPETEELVDTVIRENKHKQNLHILDIGTGSGCIALSLKNEMPDSCISAIDNSESALRIARGNAEYLQLHVEFINSDILNKLTWSQLPLSDIIVSNPPYVLESEKKSMKSNVLDHEPGEALFVPDSDPLLFYRKIAAYAKRKMKPDGKLYLEINETMGDKCRKLFQKAGFGKAEIRKDLQGKDRFLIAE